MPLIQFVQSVVDELDHQNDHWMAALYHEQIRAGRFWAMVYRNSWPIQRSRALLQFHDFYNPMDLAQNDMSPHLWFEIKCVRGGGAGMPPYDVYVPVDLGRVNYFRQQEYLDTVGLIAENLHAQPNGWTPAAHAQTIAFLAHPHRVKLDAGTVAPLLDDHQSLNNCVQFILQRFGALPYH